MRLSTLALVCIIAASGCGGPEPEPIEGPDPAVEMTEEAAAAEEGLAEDTGRSNDPDAID